MFNRREQVALLFLAGALLTGTSLAVVDYYHPSSLEEFAVVPRAIPIPEPVATPRINSGPIRLNTATADQLQQLPAIGPQTAARILQYRREHGRFKSVEELQKVRGIGVRTLEKLRPFVALD